MERSKKNLLFLLAGLGAIFAGMHKQAVAGHNPVLNAEQVDAIAKETLRKHGFETGGVDLLAIAYIESSFNPTASRYEAHIRDASIGIMQTLGETARWLASEMGYTAYGVPDMEDLMKPEISMYFGAAFIDWLSRYYGVKRSEKWIVESYNGGPGNSNNQTRAYYQKYLRAKQKLR